MDLRYEINSTEDGYEVYDTLIRTSLAVFPVNKAQGHDVALSRAERYLARLLLCEE